MLIRVSFNFKKSNCTFTIIIMCNYYIYIYIYIYCFRNSLFYLTFSFLPIPMSSVEKPSPYEVSERTSVLRHMSVLLLIKGKSVCGRVTWVFKFEHDIFCESMYSGSSYSATLCTLTIVVVPNCCLVHTVLLIV